MRASFASLKIACGMPAECREWITATTDGETGASRITDDTSARERPSGEAAWMERIAAATR
jgi:hypothetical protein